MTIRLRYTRKHAAELLDISERELDRLRAAGQIIAEPVGRTVYYRHDELLAYLDAAAAQGRAAAR